MLKRIVFIGAGNVASHIAPALEESGAGVVVQVYSRTIESARLLASELHDACPVDEVGLIVDDADIYIISVADDAIATLVDKIKEAFQSREGRERLYGEHLADNSPLWLHTSGSIGMEALSSLSSRYGVFYPLQTFSKNVDLDVSEVPLFIEGNSRETLEDIKAFAIPSFKRIYEADSRTRRMMHISAVFACNFTNHLWTLASEILAEEGIPFDVLCPLLEETMRKAFATSPAEGQTGPAARGDKRVINSHMKLLEGDKRIIYQLLSDSIISRRDIIS